VAAIDKYITDMITQGSGDIYYFLLDGILDVQMHANMPSTANAKQTRKTE
jgi:hypothetical protein